MNSYTLILVRVGQYLIRFHAVMNGRLIDVQEYSVRTEHQKKVAKDAMKRFGLREIVNWSRIERIEKCEHVYKLPAEYALNSYHGWPKQDELSTCPEWKGV